MAADERGLSKRGRTSEDEYFARRDREVIETERRKAADAAELRRLGEALGLSDEELLTKLRAAGFGPSHVALVPVLPALEVAWSDGSVGQAEGELLKEQLRRYSDGQQPSPEAIAKLDDFLLTRPPDHLFDQGRRAAQVAVSRRGSWPRRGPSPRRAEACLASEPCRRPNVARSMRWRLRSASLRPDRLRWEACKVHKLRFGSRCTLVLVQ
jgi:hypothetical protein